MYLFWLRGPQRSEGTQVPIPAEPGHSPHAAAGWSLEFAELHVEPKIVQALVNRVLNVRVVPKPCDGFIRRSDPPRIPGFPSNYGFASSFSTFPCISARGENSPIPHGPICKTC